MTATMTNERTVLRSRMTDEIDAEGKRFGRRIFGAFDMREALKKITTPLRPRSMKWEEPKSLFPDTFTVCELSEWDIKMNAKKLAWLEAQERVKAACGEKLWEEMRTAHAEYLVMLHK